MNELDIVDRLSIHRTMSQYLTGDQLLLALNCDRAAAKVEIERLRTELSELLAKTEAQAVPIFQIRMREGGASGAWIDVSEAIFNDSAFYQEYVGRKLYTTPPEQQAASLTTPTLNASCVPDSISAFIAERVKSYGLVERAYNEAPSLDLQVALGTELQWWLRLPELLAAAPSPTGLNNPEAQKPNDKYTFVFPDASMTKIRFIFVDGEMVYENLEPEQ